MARDRRRPGDERPRKHVKGVPLNLTPTQRPIRWLPRYGDPTCLLEWVAQRTITALAYLPVYTAIVATLCLVVLVLGPPFA